MPGSDLNEMASEASSFGPPTLKDSPLAGYEQSPLLGRAGFRHAFFTRLGGVSTGPFESLSFSTAVGDSPRNVDENLARAAAVLGVEAERILYLSQVHGSVTHYFTHTERRERSITLEGDAVGGAHPGSAYGVRSADCVPLLVADQRSGAVMAIHAGWRGVVGGAVEAGVECLRQRIGGGGELLAAIGPHISAAAFEVSDEVAEKLAAACPVSGAVEQSAGQKPRVSLRFIVTQKLLALGLPESAIDQVGGCTSLDQARYFSFRRDGKTSGGHLSAIVPRPSQP
ncbi:MAG TPA: polyphenol oxidase family protein [Polyangiaceae bacterium]|nr:polyphenol oxidase family protein [Polyangiaceae bacterium]